MKNYQQKEVAGNDKKEAAKAIPVTEYMVHEKDLIAFHPDTEIMKVVGTLLEHRIAGAPVLNEKKEMVGLIDDKDCLKILFDSVYHNQPVNKSTVADYMSNVLKTISVKADIFEVADIFLSTKYKRLLVVDEDNRLVGQISRQDILQAIHDFNAQG